MRLYYLRAVKLTHVGVITFVQERRRRAVEELVRILQPGGQGLVYVWAQEQKKDNQKSKYLKPQREHRQHSKHGDPTSQQGQGGGETSNEGVEEGLCLEREAEGESGDFSSSAGNHDAAVREMGSLKLSSDREEENKLYANECDSALTKSHCHCDNGDADDSAELDKDSQCSDTGSAVLQVHVNRTEFKEQDMLVPWQLKKGRGRGTMDGEGGVEDKPDEQTYHRYYHVFKQGELEALCGEVGGCVVKRSYYDQGNWCVVLQKL
jgi:alkylated DNA repair protein alkB family protein 8